jgi:hypothetical protein
MQKLHIEYDQEGSLIPDQSITKRLILLAQALIGATGAVIDVTQHAYRYDEHFVFLLVITGLKDKARVALSSSTEPLSHEDFPLLVEDAVDAIEIMQALRTQLRLQSLPLLCAASSVSPAGSARAIAVSDVIRWHEAQISHFQAERDRLAQWSKDNDGCHPGALYERCAENIELHRDIIARIAELSI